MKHAARFYEKSDNSRVHCFLCPHNCVIEEGHYGKCNVRTNEKGELFTINYGEITSAALDPIEKKPLLFFKPSSHILSVGSFGCNMTCTFCQNYNISQERPEGEYVPPEQLIKAIKETKNNIGIAFTYNEPSIWYEYVYDCASLLKKNSPEYDVVLVSNGFISTEPLRELLPFVGAMNIDLKSYSNHFYKNICGASLKPVLKTIEEAAGKCHVEITTLLVSGENDNLDEIEEISKFLSSIDKNIPLHLSRYFPRYKMKNPATSPEIMRQAKAVAEKYLSRVQLGNV